jgi:hypothetical protein
MSKSDLTTFADAFPEQMKEKVSSLAASLIQSAEAKLETLLQEPTLTTALRQSRALESVSGGGLKIGWSDKAAIGVDVGRIQSQPYTRRVKGGGKSVSFTRLLGSAESPLGFTKPAIAGLRLGWEQVAQDAGKDF